MKTLRKATLFFLVALVCVLLQLVLHAAESEPEVGNALEACSSLDGFTNWISDLSGETESSIRGAPSQILTRYVYSDDARTAEKYLREQFYAMGLPVTTHEVSPNMSNNLIVRIPGITTPDEVVILCAHYDSTSENPYNRAPGADDNASGTAAVLTAASILKNFRFDRTIEFCLFTAEEIGLVGSRAYAAECQATGKNIIGVINMDMLIHPTDDRQPSLPLDVDILRNGPSQKLASLLRRSIETYALLDAEVHTYTNPASDHNSFWDIGVNAVALSGNTPEGAMGGATTVYHTTNDVITQQYADLPFGLSVARGVAAAAMSLAGWEPSRSLPVGATAYAEVDGIPRTDSGQYRASASFIEDSFLEGAIAESHAENLVLASTTKTWAGGTREAICHSRSFDTFVPRSTALLDGEEVVVELKLQGSGQFEIEGKLGNLYANCRAEVWARSVESFHLFDGCVSLSREGTEISGDFWSDAFSLYSTGTREEATLSQWSEVIPFSGNMGQPITLCARLSQIAYSRGGGQAECAWTEPLRLTVTSTTPDVWLEIAGFTDEPQVSQISTDGAELAMAWQPFSQGQYTVEHSEDLISWTPIATTPFTIWRTEDWPSGRGFFRVTSE